MTASGFAISFVSSFALLRTNDTFEVFYNGIVKNFKRIISAKQPKEKEGKDFLKGSY